MANTPQDDVPEIFHAEVQHNGEWVQAVVIDSIGVIVNGEFVAQDAEVVTVASTSSSLSGGEDNQYYANNYPDATVNSRTENRLPVATPVVGNSYSDHRTLRKILELVRVTIAAMIIIAIFVAIVYVVAMIFRTW